MNQKLIDLLLHKAGARFGAEGTDYSDFTSAKFAELIINECIDQVAGTKIVGQLSGDKFAELSESADKKYTQWNNALVIATMNVRDHFGVEE
jgi:hypothetical protein